MAQAMFINADAVAQVAGTLVRTTSSPATCVLASADSSGNYANLIGARLTDVAPGASGTLAAFEPGISVLMVSAAQPGDLVYLTDDGTGRGTITPPTIPIKIGICYAATIVSGNHYAQLIIINGSTSDEIIFTTKGDLASYDGSSVVIVPVGGTDGLVLTVDSSAPCGFTWKNLPTGNTSQAGIVQVGTGPNTVCAGDDPRLAGNNPFMGRTVSATRNGTTTNFAQPYMSWQSAGSLPTGGWYGVVWDPDHDRFVAISNGATSPGASYYSVDGGNSWTLGGQLSASLTAWFKIFHDPYHHTLIAVPQGTTVGAVYSTDGGITWLAGGSAIVSDTWFDGAFDPDHNRLVMTSTTSTRSMYTNDGGVTWQAGGTLPNGMGSVAWDPLHNRLVALPATATGTAYSTDGGSTWVAGGLVTNALWHGLCWDPLHQILIGVANLVAQTIRSNDGGLSWSNGGTLNNPTGASSRQLVYNSSTGQLITSDLGTTNNWITSNGGATWESVTGVIQVGPIIAVVNP